MSFLLKRFSYFENKTYGRLYYESTYLCDTLEGMDMLLEDRLPNTGEVIRKNKDKKIAIPRGTYTLTKIKSNTNNMTAPTSLTIASLLLLGFSKLTYFSSTRKPNEIPK